MVQILTEGLIVPGHILVAKLDIRYADATQQLPQATGFGVSVLQGSFTLWNQQAAATLTAELRDISIGRRGMPANGGGVFVAGFSEDVISLEIPLLTTRDIFTNGRIPAVQPGTVFISGGIAVSWGAHAQEVIGLGSVITFGNYDMVLDNWGKVDRWIAEQPVTSYGNHTAIGFVNYGEIGELVVNGPIETFGAGSRGFNEYNGSLESADFLRITTHGDAAPGIHVGCPVKRLRVREGIETFGGSGTALLSGKFVQLPAYGLSVIPGGALEEIAIEGGIVPRGSYTVPATGGSVATTVPVATLDLQGSVGTLRVTGGMMATATAG